MPRTEFSRLGLWILALAGSSLVLALILLRGREDPQPPGIAHLTGERPQDVVPEARNGPDDLHPVADGTGRRSVAEPMERGGFPVRVVDPDGAPIRGAQAMTDSDEGLVVSDAAGVLKLCAPAAAGLVVADGYLPRALECGDSPCEVQLERDPGLALTLLWEDGEPVAGARVEAVFEEALASPGPVAITGEDGRALVPSYRSGFVTAHLWAQPAGGSRRLVILPDDLDLAGAPSYEARIRRADDGHLVRVVDDQDRPLADREVELRRNVEEVVRTDAQGRARFASQPLTLSTAVSEGGRASCTVEIEDGRAWWHEPRFEVPAPGETRTLRVAPRRVHGRVETPAPRSYRVATAATRELSSVRNALFHPRDLSELLWQPIREDGSFECVDGWQGPESVVLLRHRDHLTALWIEPVPEGGGPVVLRAPDVCRVTVEAASPAPAAGTLFLHSTDLSQPRRPSARAEFGIQLMADMATLSLEFPPLPETLELPRARYEVAGVIGASQWSETDLDATGPTATLRLDVPSSVNVRGRLVGSLRGPLAGVTLRFANDHAENRREAVTDAEGWFEARVLGRGPIRVEPDWRNGPGLVGVPLSQALEPPLTADRPSAEYVIPEAVLRVVERPPSPLLRFKSLWLTPVHTGGATASGVKLDLDPAGTARAHVAPGAYRIHRRFGAGHGQEASATVEVDQEVAVVLDSSRLAVIALEVTVVDPQRSELRLRARAADGSLAALDGERRPGDEPWEFQKVVEPGLYRIEVESRARGAPLAESPRDVWHGEFQAVPGARTPLRIHLR